METNNTNLNKGLVLSASVLGIALVVMALVASNAFYKIRSLDNTLSATGSTKQSVTADKVKWNMQVTRNANLANLAIQADALNKDTNAVLAFLKEKGIADDKITTLAPMTNEVWQNDANALKIYTVSQTITVATDEVEKIAQIAKETQPILAKGILFTTTNLEYYYSKLPELRISMLKDAMADAKARANEIAKAGGKNVGSLKSASSGVVQVLASGSNDISDYGSYDTSTINKDVMLTVKAVFTTN